MLPQSQRDRTTPQETEPDPQETELDPQQEVQDWDGRCGVL